MDKFVKIFIKEAEEFLEKMTNDLISLENKPDDSELISNIFRYAHTIKGGAAGEGFENASKLAHSMENLLGKVRDGQLSVNAEVIDILLKCTERIEGILNAIPEGKNAEIEIADIEEGLNQYLDMPSTKDEDKEKSLALTEKQKTIIFERVNKGDNIFEVMAEFLDSEKMKAMRGLLVLNELKKKGEVVFSSPDIESLKSGTLNSSNAEHKVIRIWICIDSNEKEIKEIADVGALKQLDVKRVAKKKPSVETTGNNTKPHTESSKDETIRVRVKLLDGLVNNVGELLICSTQIEDTVSQLQEFKEADPLFHRLKTAVSQLKKITTEMEDISLKSRLVPISIVFDRFPKTVRELSKKLNKQINFVIKGGDSELDKDLVERLSDPLIHLMRNSIDHGIEMPEIREKLGKPKKGNIILSASREGNYIVIDIEDDGKGISVEKIKQKAIEKGLISSRDIEYFDDSKAFNLLFEAGFSTVDIVSEISGRGVGMDVVKKMLDEMKGVVNIESHIGKGCKISMKFPLTLAIITSMLVYCGGRIIAIPCNSIKRLIKVSACDILHFDHYPVIKWRDEVIPLFNLDYLLWGTMPSHNQNKTEEDNIVIIGHSKNLLALKVGSFKGEENIVVKPFESDIADSEGISGATILGTGEIPLILDITGIMNIATKKRDSIRHGEAANV